MTRDTIAQVRTTVAGLHTGLVQLESNLQDHSDRIDSLLATVHKQGAALIALQGDFLFLRNLINQVRRASGMPTGKT